MRIVAVIAFMSLLSACSAVPGFAQLQGAFVVGTDKTLEDHVISYTSGKDCSSVRKEKGLTYCIEDEPKVTQNIYCYKTLANVTCYDRPNPLGGRQKKIGDNDHNMPK